MGLQAINLTKRQAITDDDYIVDITDMFDSDGDNTENVSACVAFVAGPDINGVWFSGVVADFEPTQLN